ncbi:MAG: mersacidin/lichenicidin family type 2 lantibiotic [Pirellulaceae bacterium]|nr:mersacidin/lichenicidin family type 2 lantibiotic [Planctomycetales bacterium]
MNMSDVIRAWKDPSYRASLSAEQRATLPANPAGAIDVTQNELNTIEGGAGSGTLVCPTRYLAVNQFVSVQCPMVVDYKSIVTLPVDAAIGQATLRG